MLLAELAKLLTDIADRGGPFGSEGERCLRVLAGAIEQQGTLEADALVKLLKPKATRATREAPAPSAIVDAYLAEFQNAGSSADAEAILVRMGRDRSVKKPETVAIAQGFTGSKKSFKTKAAAQDLIRETIKREAWDQVALEILRSRAMR